MAQNQIKTEEFIYIAGSAMVAKKNLEEIGNGIQFISRLPANYSECSNLIKDAINKDDWVELGKLSGTTETRKRPAAIYKAFETEAVVIHSSAHDKRRQNRIDRELKKETGCFVLLCNVPIDGDKGYSSYDILRAYKDLYGIEQNFGFIKNTPLVNSIFLKKAERIEVLALVLLISLLVWRLIEPLSQIQLEYLRALGLNSRIFTNPRG